MTPSMRPATAVTSLKVEPGAYRPLVARFIHGEYSFSLSISVYPGSLSRVRS